MIANPRFDAGRFRAPADDAVGVLLEEGIGCKHKLSFKKKRPRVPCFDNK